MDSRIHIKDLPRECDETLLKKHFSSCGLITDCKIMRTPSGKSRQFGFIGFFSQEARDKALKLHHSYIRTCRIVVEKALPHKSKELPRAWSKYSRGTSAYKERETVMTKVREARKEKKAKRRNNRQKRLEEERLKREKKLEKFVKQKTGNVWENDDFEVPPELIGNEDLNDDESSSEEEESQGFDNIVAPPPKITSGQSSMSDLDWLKAKTVKSDEESKKEEKNEATLLVAKPPPEKKTPVLEEGRLFIRNLSYSSKEEDLEQLFSKFGDLSEVYYPIDKTHKKPKGIAFVTFVIPSNAKKAMGELNGKYFHGRILHILPAYESNRKNEHVEKATKNIRSSFKKSQKKTQKLSAGSAFNWNTLYIRPDAAVAGVAKQLGVTQTSLTGSGTDDSGAVRVALAETQVIQEIRASLDSLGISVGDVFRSEGDKVRSNTIILVKNLNSGTRSSDLEDLFSKYGEIRQVKMVTSTGTFAVVRYFSRNDALRAFQNLSYFQMNGKPMFLEWAPMKQKKKGIVKKVDGIVKIESEEVSEEEESEEESEEKSKKKALSSSTLYVKNLNFQSTEHSLREFIKRLMKNQKMKFSCKIVKDKFGYSQGFGFLSFGSGDVAIDVRRKINGKVLDGHQLSVSFSRIEKKNERDIGNAPPSVTGTNISRTREGARSKTKIIVKNLAFEATRKDLFGLFGTFGEIEEIRIPRKVSGGHRGFAFLEFVSEEECARAMDTLRSTHLYGRSLVLEYALEEESVARMRGQVRDSILKKRKRDEMVQPDGKIHFKKNVKRRRIEGK